MDPKFLMEAMQTQMASGGLKDMGMDEAGLKSMMEMIETCQKDPEQRK